ncbi:MAG: hypothetical protein AB8H86_19405 [Polyangiales bacterium]
MIQRAQIQRAQIRPAGRKTLALSLALAAAALLWAPTAQAERLPLRFGIEGHVSLLSNQVDRSLLNITFGGGIRLGYRGEGARWGGFLLFEQNAWYATDLFQGVVPGVRNLGLGLERLWSSRLVRTSVVVGISMLAYDTELNSKNTTGLFFDLRPATLRWHITRSVVFELTPLHFVVVAPVLDEPRLVTVQYRTTLGLEFILR